MRLRSFLILGAVTALMVVAAAVSVTNVDRTTTVASAGEKLFPALAESADALAAIRIRDREHTLTVERSDDGWGLAEKNGYPVALDKIRGTLVALARFEKVEAKTRNPDLYGRLQIEDVDSENARSKELTLLDADGRTLAGLIVGKFALGTGDSGGLYVRKPDEGRAWLVRGRLDVGLEPRDWVETRIVDIPPVDVKRVTIEHPDGEILEVAKESIEAPFLELRNLPDGAKPKREGIAGPLASVLSGLDLEDLKPAGDIPFAAEDVVRATVATFDGVVVTVDLVEHDGGKWIRLDAESRPDEAGEDTAGNAEESVRRLHARTKDWVYQVPTYKVAPLQKRIADFADLAPPAS